MDTETICSFCGQVLVHGDHDDAFDGDDIIITLLLVVILDKSIHTKEPIRDSILTGPEWVKELTIGHSDRIYEAFRMERCVFRKLCKLMKDRVWLKDSRYIRIDEQVGMFLYLIGHGSSNRDLCERFQHSGQTVSKYLNKVLRAVLKLAREIIKPPSFDDVPSEIFNNPKHFPYFKDCIGAIDGTHISATIPESKQISYRGRKEVTTQNIMCACSFDMKFTFIYAGWEGSANDCRVFSTALHTPSLQFPHPPPGKYYVADSGYPSTPGFFIPFKGERYHLNDYRGRGRQARTAREFFNYRHSSLRNVIERLFGALKNRFPILRKMPPFSLRMQAHIVTACCAIHNYIRDHQREDRNLARFQSQSEEVVVDAQEEGVTQMNTVRKNIANQMARDNSLNEI